MIIKAIILLFFVFIFYSLGSALYFLVCDKQTRVVKALTWRIALSVIMFIFLMIAYVFGWIMPHSIV